VGHEDEKVLLRPGGRGLGGLCLLLRALQFFAGLEAARLLPGGLMDSSTSERIDWRQNFCRYGGLDASEKDAKAAAVRWRWGRGTRGHFERTPKNPSRGSLLRFGATSRFVVVTRAFNKANNLSQQPPGQSVGQMLKRVRWRRGPRTHWGTPYHYTERLLDASFIFRRHGGLSAATAAAHLGDIGCLSGPTAGSAQKCRLGT